MVPKVPKYRDVGRIGALLGAVNRAARRHPEWPEERRPGVFALFCGDTPARNLHNAVFQGAPYPGEVKIGPVTVTWSSEQRRLVVRAHDGQAETVDMSDAAIDAAADRRRAAFLTSLEGCAAVA